MRQILAIVKPFMAERVVNSVTELPVEALTVREVKGYGRQKNYLAAYGDNEYSMAFLPKVEISLWIKEDRVEETLRTMLQAARTGRMGDGKIFVLPVIRTEREIEF